jgi:hypothetical protein
MFAQQLVPNVEYETRKGGPQRATIRGRRIR